MMNRELVRTILLILLAAVVVTGLIVYVTDRHEYNLLVALVALILSVAALIFTFNEKKRKRS
ncbi:hypothetical protein JMA_03860 [Jeotgalibacillus malaysiensis]|uniref:Uncharacterized protein n=1 Tax=Jeotgalibacillus malaysiensis TaxID=1508404 RepID=A0A0B5AMB9_9BACL|nr:hypothetical protein JMA_03860 [Jeotgalibacillus malaysiensis]